MKSQYSQGNPYEDIMELPNHKSVKHQPMSIYQRAAQFSPFAALTGHAEAIRETERLTEQKMELDEHQKEELDFRLQQLEKRIHTQPEVEIEYFQKDTKKDGGKYVTITGQMKRIHRYQQMVILMDGTEIPLEDIIRIETKISERI